LRGGSWIDSAPDCRVVIRGGHVPAHRYGKGGFRVVLSQ